MNYYEEFGLEPGASTEEVRQVYRMLVRVLHPDAQPDPQLRVVAERQMMRLNDIFATLTDPQKRRAYDETLRISAKLPSMGRGAMRRPGLMAEGRRPMVILPIEQPAWRPVAVRHWFCILIAGTCLVTGIAWYGVPRSATAEAVPTLPAEAVAGTVDASAPIVTDRRTGPIPRPVNQSSASRRKSVRRLSAPEPAMAPHFAAPTHPRTTLPAAEPVAESATRPAEPAATRQPASPAAPRFAGNWLYTPPGRERAVPGRYRAIYVECLLREEGGQIVGTYQAKYRVPDQAISPEVKFQVRGATPAGDSGRVVWTASDGAQGAIELTLRSPDSMSVAWWTTSAGRRPMLSSGEGVLIREVTR